MEQYGALLHQRWTPGLTGEDIVGFWAEDGSSFAIKVPHQLRDCLLSLQARLSERYCEIERKSRELSELKANIDRLLT